MFAIDRTSDACRTPRRNKEIERALAELRRLSEWSHAVASYFSRAQLFSVVSASDWSAANLDGAVAAAVQQLFVPVLALLEDRAHLTIEGSAATSPTGAVTVGAHQPTDAEVTSHELLMGDSNALSSGDGSRCRQESCRKFSAPKGPD